MWAVIAILILVGILLVIMEILVIPGVGLAGIMGFLSMATGVWFADKYHGEIAGNVTLAATVLLNVLAVILSLRSKTWKKAQLKSSIDGKAGGAGIQSLKVGDLGKTISRCVPMGKVLFSGNYYEANAGTEFIDPDKGIEIIKIEGNKIFIKPLTT